jgi:hypothetical protein
MVFLDNTTAIAYIKNQGGTKVRSFATWLSRSSTGQTRVL